MLVQEQEEEEEDDDGDELEEFIVIQLVFLR